MSLEFSFIIAKAEERRNHLAWMQKIALPAKHKLNPW